MKFTAQNLDPNATTEVTPLDWNPTETGFSGAGPTVNAKYAQVGKVGYIWYDTLPSSGVSNATTFTITNLPLSPSVAVVAPIRALDNDAWKTVPYMMTIAAGSTTAVMCTDWAGGQNWTAANSKGVMFQVSFPIA